jgi:endonuclease/exonuclease/phosphatase family metal-dependent hydrolase
MAAGCALVVAVTGGGEPSAASSAEATFTLLQMNLCLSGWASCYDKASYPAGVAEAVARIRDMNPDAVTVNEACHGDLARIARQTGYHLRFSTVRSAAGPLRCVRPAGRGRFGDAVLTKAAIERSQSREFAAQTGSERRRWLCVTTRIDVAVCTAHLATDAATAGAGNERQCAELATILARRMVAHTVIFGGDVNRRRPCAPDGLWTGTDRSADQAPGLQHIYASGSLRSLSLEVLPAAHTDHDVLLIRTRPATAPPGPATTTAAVHRARARPTLQIPLPVPLPRLHLAQWKPRKSNPCLPRNSLTVRVFPRLSESPSSARTVAARRWARWA